MNLVVTAECNYNCRFCFGRYYTFCRHIDSSRILELPGLLADAGVQKITFEGGEPLLFPGLLELVIEAKEQGLTTVLVTNGSLLTKGLLKELSGTLDWLGLSVDSTSEEVESQLGRGFGSHVQRAFQIAGWAHEMNLPLKINSVITKLNYGEDLSGMIRRMAPMRFKTFQMLSIKGENDMFSNELEITSQEFDSFINNHVHLIDEGIDFIPETKADMLGSYIMMLPDGRFFNNTDQVHTYGEYTVFEVGVEMAFNDIQWDASKFLERRGLYDWDIKKRDIPNNTYPRSTRVNGPLSNWDSSEKEGEKNGI